MMHTTSAPKAEKFGFTVKAKLGRGHVAPPSRVHGDKRRSPRSKDRQELRNWNN